MNYSSTQYYKKDSKVNYYGETFKAIRDVPAGISTGNSYYWSRVFGGSYLEQDPPKAREEDTSSPSMNESSFSLGGIFSSVTDSFSAGGGDSGGGGAGGSD